MAHYLITGGTGFIGTTLVRDLSRQGHQITILSRYPQKHVSRFPRESVTWTSDLGEIDSSTRIDGIINLAGENIADRRWSQAQKARLLASRLRVTEAVIALLQRLTHKPAVMVSGSAVGFYGSQPAETVLDETAEPHHEFTHELCSAWENEARKAGELGVRVCLIRTAPVLERHGGMLKKLRLPFALGLGGQLGDGKQPMSWIHLRDEVNAIRFLLDTPQASGAYNLASPDPVTNARFTKALASAMRRPAFMRIPGFAVKLLFGEMGDTLLLHGQHVVPKRLLDAGFAFQHPVIDDALVAIFRT